MKGRKPREAPKQIKPESLVSNIVALSYERNRFVGPDHLAVCPQIIDCFRLVGNNFFPRVYWPPVIPAVVG